MILTFLGADRPLTKTLHANGEWSSYPLVKTFTSYEEECHTLDDVFDALRVHAALGHCLLKGRLRAPLKDMPRAGQTDSHEPTQLLILDYDTEDNKTDVEQFLNLCDTSLATTSHILQRSCKAGFLPEHEHRCHIFFMLNKETLPQNIKTWLTHVNLQSFKDQITLAENHAALRWPIDVSVNQNDKLIYIAPPICDSDPIADRITLNERQHTHFVLPTADFTYDGDLKLDLLRNLREAKGLKRTLPRTTVTKTGLEIFCKTTGVQITGIRESVDFIHCNLNGGDSWGYWIAKDTPDYVQNFKGEPAIKLNDIDADLHKRLYGKKKEQQRHLRGGLRVAPFIGIDHNTDDYIKFEYDRDADALIYFKYTTADKCKHFMQEFGLEQPSINRWKVVFEPNSEKVIDIHQNWVNTFKPTEHMLAEPGATEVPPTIKLIINHLCCCHEETVNELLNWLAWIFQKRTRTQTAWIFQGCPGTGKGLLKDHILRPIFDPYTYTVLLDSLTKEFNHYFENRLFLFIDEADFESINRPENLLSRVKNAITDPYLSIRKMRTDCYEVKNFLNVVLFSNELIPISIGAQDRRFNVAPRQDLPLKTLYPDWGDSNIRDIEREIPQFASFLAGYKCFREPNIPFESTARDILADVSRSSVELFADAIRRGTAAYFVQYLSATPQLDPAYWQFAAIVEQFIIAAVENSNTDTKKPTAIPVPALRHLYNYIQGSDISPGKFGRLLSAKGIRSAPLLFDGTMARCISVTWQGDVGSYLALIKSTTRTAIESLRKSA